MSNSQRTAALRPRFSLLSLALCGLVGVTHAASSRTLSATIPDLATARDSLNQWFAEGKVQLQEQELGAMEVEYTLMGSQVELDAILNRTQKIAGIRVQRLTKSEDSRASLTEIQMRRQDCQNRANDLSERFKKTEDPTALTILQPLLTEAQDCVRRAQTDLEQATLDSAKHTLVLKIQADRPQDNEGQDGWFSFVNMPGATWTYWSLENQTDRTAEAYQGLGFRYMFFRSRTWVSFSVLKPEGEFNQENGWSDLLVWGVGTDFYSRLLGHGRRTWGNPYSGFAFGGTYLSTEAEVSEQDYYSWLAPHVGIELLRVPWLLWDVQGGYHFPLGSKYSRDLRAWQLQSSVNLLF